MSNFSQVIERYRAKAFSERDKGTRFERLMKAYFMTEPLYKTTIKTVWMWNEFPSRDDFGGNDIGIDLVAMTNDGDYWAIQCKCYAEDAPITKGSVDSFIATTGKKFHDEELPFKSFSRGLFVSTSRNLSANVYEVFQNQHIPFNILTLDALESSPVDWAKLDQDIYGDAAALKERDLLDHQKIAVEKFHEHFKTADRGRLIMACGTGKTFTSLRIAEQEAPNGLVLFLVPSIALLGQTLEEWSTYAAKPLKAVCVCSDAEVSRRRKKDEDEKSNELLELAYPASTDVGTIIRQFDAKRSGNPEGMTVFFSTYQSIEKVAEAQRALNLRKGGSAVFDLIVCDEAHRTTGVSLGDGNGGYDESAFVRVHDNDFIQGRKRLYMTATPRLYKLSDEIKEMYEKLQRMMDQMNQQNNNKEEVKNTVQDVKKNTEELNKTLDQQLELFKQLEFEKKYNDIIDKAKKLSEEQKALSKQSEQKAIDKQELLQKQQDIENQFNELKKDINDLNKLNKELEDPNKLLDTKELQQQIEQDFKESKDALNKNKIGRAHV